MLDWSIHFTDIIAIGASTGGPDALAKILRSLPEALPVPVVITLHVNEEFNVFLEQRFNRESKLPFHIAKDGQNILPGHVYLAPGGKHLVFKKNKNDLISYLNEGPLVNSCRPSVDVMAKSLSDIPNLKTLFLMLTGMGDDGVNGVRDLKKKLTTVITQTEKTCVIYGMPKAIDDANLSDFKMTLEEMNKFIEEKFILFSRVKKHVSNK